MEYQRLRAGIIGGGFITQAMHLPSLIELADRFEIVCLADPSQAAREALASRYRIAATFAGHEELLAAGLRLDALLVFSPGATHARVIMAALESGLHVFTEKPLCLVAKDAWEIARASERHDRIVQVGYMKRYDPAYEQLLASIGERDDVSLRLIDGVTYDPGLERFFAPAAMARSEDIPADFIAREREHAAEQAMRAVGASSAADIKLYVRIICDGLVHDVNVLHGVLSELGEPTPKVLDTAWWADGQALQTTLELSDGARCTPSFLQLQGLQDFREELRVHCADEIHVLRFPAPYIRHSPTRYDRTTERGGRSHVDRWESWTESFTAELIHFYDCVRLSRPCRTPPQQAACDLELLQQIFKANRREEASQ